ncbi:MAG TPA: UDP-N-acetylmuramoyl-L-alanyl-D-glutamate--2,6-diaminopimelate ligase [Candidatus Tectomicrobia bacterium]|nr:UDP-N-acetylmuramoyl-L-alanyl-D-glutamate--2,6-diaminopimelate ligase [Candidatus Tectomicrobia bacterium]
MATLDELVTGLRYEVLRGSTTCALAGITSDSRQVKPGWAFVAIAGSKADGHRFIDQALAQGATVLVVERGFDLSSIASATCLRVPDTRQALAHLAAAFYGNPSRQLRLIGVTGTNGKTTSTYLLEAVLQAHSLTPGVIGTVTYRYLDHAQPAAQTTPAAEDIQRMLAQMVDAGVSHCAMEVSSHALAQHRVWGCQFAAALFTNLTQDHLDYHEDMAAYYAAKARLFTTYQPEVAVLNGDDPAGRQLLSETYAPAITYGFSPESEVGVDHLEMDAHGIRLTARVVGRPVTLHSRLIGRHNVYNILGVLAMAKGLGLDMEQTVQGIARLPTVPGRFERVDAGQPYSVLVDYAHTDDALRNVLQAARGLATGRTIVVFGAGGDRDRGKRPRMGRVAAQYADMAVITSDNPRTEAPIAIIRAIEAGFRDAGGLSQYRVIEDRARAIHEAIRLARAGDVVVIAGKGHETYQIIDGQRLSFDDRRVAAQALHELGYVPTSTVPF